MDSMPHEAGVERLARAVGADAARLCACVRAATHRQRVRALRARASRERAARARERIPRPRDGEQAEIDRETRASARRMDAALLAAHEYVVRP